MGFSTKWRDPQEIFMQERAVTESEALQSKGHIYIASFLQSCSSHNQRWDREGLTASISYCRTSQESLTRALQHLSKPISSAGRVCVLQRVQTDVQELLQDETQLGAEFPVELMANQPPGDAGRVTSCSGHHLLRHQIFAGVLLTSSQSTSSDEAGVFFRTPKTPPSKALHTFPAWVSENFTGNLISPTDLGMGVVNRLF